MAEKTKKEDKKYDMQQLYMEFQMMGAAAEEMQRRQQVIGARIAELHAAREALEGLGKIKAGGHTLVQIGGGNFACGTITDSKNVIVSIGSGIAIKKPIAGAMLILEERVDEMEKILEEVSAELSATVAQLGHMQAELEKSRAL